MNLISAVIITLNEAHNIERCLISLQGIVDEIVVLDSFSKDSTKEICEKYNVKFYERKWEGYSASKNYGNQLATHDLIFSIDADECLSEKLQQSILSFKLQNEYKLARLKRLTNYCGSWIKHCGWYPDYKERIFHRKHTQWQGVLHETLHHDAKYKVYELEGDLLHYSYHEPEDHIKQIEKFTDIAARDAVLKGQDAFFLKPYFSALLRFIKMYLLQLGFLDGKAGWQVCTRSAYAAFLKYTKIIQFSRIKNIRHILISRTDAIGDVMLTIPLAKYIKEKMPNVRVSFLGNTYTKPILAYCQSIDEIIEFASLQKLSKAAQIETLASKSIDAIVHVFPNPAIAALAKQANIPLRIGTTNRVYHWFTCNILIRMSRKKSELHEAELNFSLLEGLAINSFPKKETLHQYYDLKVDIVDDIVKEYIDKNKVNLILHTKSRGSAREWGLENFRQLISRLNKDKYNIILSGTEEEGLLFREQLVKPYDYVKDASGKFTLKQFIQLIKASDALVAASTGPLHIAAALGLKAVGLYAPLKPLFPQRWGPLGEKAKALAIDKNCDDCKNGSRCLCIESIQVDDVIQAIES